MKFKWERVKNLRELEIEDVVRVNPKYKRSHLFERNIIISGISQRENDACYLSYNSSVIIKNNELIYKSLSHPAIVNDCCFAFPNTTKWIEKLIVEEEKDMDKYSDEVDLLLDNVMTDNLSINKDNIVSYISSKLENSFVKMDCFNNIQIIFMPKHQLKIDDEPCDTKSVDEYINSYINECICAL